MVDPQICSDCRTEIAPGLLTCPGCHRLLHAERLKALAATAKAAECAEDYAAALVAWNEAHALLPSTARQAAVIAEKIGQLGRLAETSPRKPPATDPSPSTNQTEHGWTGKAGLAGAGALGLGLLKFKFLLPLLLTKAKFLALGLTKMSTLLSMFASFGLYLQLFGWGLAAGLIISIYIHEIGHVYVLSRYGILHNRAPLFLPGLGAVTLLQQNVVDPRQDARMGLAGPFWGLGAAAGFAAAHVLLQSPTCGAIAKLGAVINLFNLIPIGTLDGGRAFRSLTRSHRWLATAGVATVWAVVAESKEMVVGALILLMLGAVARIFWDSPALKPDLGALTQYLLLVVTLTALSMLPVAI